MKDPDAVQGPRPYVAFWSPGVLFSPILTLPFLVLVLYLDRILLPLDARLATTASRWRRESRQGRPSSLPSGTAVLTKEERFDVLRRTAEGRAPRSKSHPGTSYPEGMEYSETDCDETYSGRKPREQQARSYVAILAEIHECVNKVDGDAGCEEGIMCQANMPAHWIESARDPLERRRREAALDALFREYGGSVPGPLLLDFIRRWPKPPRGAGAAQRAWERGEFVKPKGRPGKGAPSSTEAER